MTAPEFGIDGTDEPLAFARYHEREAAWLMNPANDEGPAENLTDDQKKQLAERHLALASWYRSQLAER